MAKFQQTLQSLTKVLKKKGIFETLGVPARDPTKFDIEYVHALCATINHKREGCNNASICKRFIDRCFQATYKRSDGFAGLIDLIPRDVWGSVISGGFTLILAAVERHEERRATIQKALADIPRKLDKIRRLGELRSASPHLHHDADAVMVAIFAVLERIIEWLLKSWSERTISTFKGKGGLIQEALEDLEACVSDFKDEIETCMHVQLSKMEQGLGQIDQGLHGIRAKVDGFDEKLTAIREELREERVAPDVFQHVCNALYQFFYHNPNFSPIDGTVNHQAMIAALSETRRTKNRLAQMWFERLSKIEPSPDFHRMECLKEFHVFDEGEKQKAHWIMTSHQLREWFNSKGSCILSVHAEYPPEELMSAMTSSSATLTTILKPTNFAVLSFFCGLRTNESLKETHSGAVGFLNSLNGQLIEFIHDKRDPVHLELSEEEKSMRKSTRQFKHALRLFRTLLEALPQQDMVFVVLDSCSRMSGDNGDMVIGELAKIIKEMPDLTIKLVVTDPLLEREVRETTTITLYVPNEIDGYNDGIDGAQLEETQNETIKRLERQYEKGDSHSEEADSSDASEEG